MTHKPTPAHTSLPWKHRHIWGHTHTSNVVFTAIVPEDAAHIVRCVNSHDALVEALGLAFEHYERGEPFSLMTADKTRAALQLAKGE